MTPPEFADLRLAGEATGRVGGARLTLASDARGTRLDAVYQQAPVRVLPLYFTAEQAALIYLVNPTGGLMDRDAHLIEVHAKPATRCVITGQSATRVHPCLEGFSTQQWRVRVEAGATLVVLPGPTLPFPGCRYFQQVRVELAEDARFIWGDLWLAGRYARAEASERFRFDRLVQEMTVHRRERLSYRDRFAWRGPWNESTAAWHFGTSPACGCLFATGTVTRKLLPEANGVHAALLPTACGDSCLRWLGSAEDVTRCLVQTALALAEGNDAAPGRRWLQDSDLSPGHWFFFADAVHSKQSE